MKHYYRIGEISKLYQIGTDSLRYYEELGILNPHRGENNYRLYHIHDLWRLNVIRDLRELGFSMETIKQYLDNRSLASTEELLRQELLIIEEKKQSLKDLRENIEERLTTIRDAREQPLDIVIEKELAPRRCFLTRSGYEQDAEMDFLVKQLLNRSSDRISIIGNNRTGSVIPLSSVQNHLYQDYSSVFILDKQGDDVISGEKYLTITYRGNCSQNASYIPMLLDCAASHDLIPCGDCLELL